jgi:hypothetical protein
MTDFSLMTTITHKVNNSHLGCCVTSQLTMAAIGYWDVVLFGTKLDVGFGNFCC